MKLAPVILAFLLFVFPCAARTITVDANGTGDYPTIQAAIDDANNGDIIELLPGLYTGPGNRDIDFLGRAITVRSTDPNDPNIVAGTIIDCNSAGRGFVFNGGEGRDSVLAGATITNGYHQSHGGGILCHGSSPTIAHCVFSENLIGGTYWLHSGGGICNSLGDPMISNCKFIGNSANISGGGMRNYAGSPVLLNCEFIGNSANQNGGGMYDHHGMYQHGAPRLINCTFSGNSADFGGGMYNAGSNGDPRLSNCVFSENSAGQYGGGISGEAGSTLTLTNCILWGNSAGQYGGGIGGEAASSLTLANCILWGNTDSGGMGESAQIHWGWPVIDYCCIQGWTGALGGTGNIGADPCFVAPFGGDYHISADSPCIDAGDPDHWPLPGETDIDGETRVMGGRVDMGVDEFPAALIPIIGVSSTEFEFTADKGDPNPPTRVLSVCNIGADILNWGIAEDCNWLTVEPNSGTLTMEEVEDAVLSVDVSGLEEGQYNYELRVLDPNAANSPKTVVVRLIITEACFPTSYTTYADWVAYGRPNCWCGIYGDPPWPYQCDGDGENINSGMPFKYQVYTGDLGTMLMEWKKKMIARPNPCADFDHKDSGPPFFYRVYTGDLNTLLGNWKKKARDLPGDCPRPE